MSVIDDVVYSVKASIFGKIKHWNMKKSWKIEKKTKTALHLWHSLFIIIIIIIITLSWNHDSEEEGEQERAGGEGEEKKSLIRADEINTFGSSCLLFLHQEGEGSQEAPPTAANT